MDLLLMYVRTRKKTSNKYLQIDDELIKGLRKIIEVNVPKEDLMRFALSHKCKGGAHQIYPGQYYNLMKEDQYEKERLINELEGETLNKIGHDEDNDANSRQRKLARTFLSKSRQDGVDYENKFGTYNETTPRIAYTLQNYRRQLPNKAFRFLTNTGFVKEKEDLIPTSCPKCGGKNSPYQETNCKRLKNTIQVFTTKSLTMSNKFQDNTKQQKSQKRIAIASMTVQNPILRQTIEVKEYTQTLESCGTKKSIIKQRSNTTKDTRLKLYQLQWAKTARCTRKATSVQRN
ncbi:Conserved_hypothetical protein [Hexamita inflata]|uniref:Uncharacterized protein n=1 Tax=Hexamita inflata TaxID=28002 RepID=A0AA86QWA7_9EUKA|nr:Conserved hypothetical protein [Hexamita inflata]